MSRAIVHIHGLGHKANSSLTQYLLWYIWHNFGKARLLSSYRGSIRHFLCETRARVPWPFVIVMPQTSPIAMDNTAVSHPVPCPVQAFTGGRIVCLNTHTQSSFLIIAISRGSQSVATKFNSFTCIKCRAFCKTIVIELVRHMLNYSDLSTHSISMVAPWKCANGPIPFSVERVLMCSEMSQFHNVSP